MRTLQLKPEVEAQLRREILAYFREPAYAAAMFYVEPFASDLARGLYTRDELTFMRVTLWKAGLMEPVRGTTRDRVLVVTEMGRLFLQNLEDAGQ